MKGEKTQSFSRTVLLSKTIATSVSRKRKRKRKRESYFDCSHNNIDGKDIEKKTSIERLMCKICKSMLNVEVCIAFPFLSSIIPCVITPERVEKFLSML